MPLFSRIARSIQSRMSKSVEDNPDGALAKYLWLWQSMGKRPGGSPVPRPIRFFNYAIEPEHIKLDGPLKELGMYTIAIQLHEKVKADVKVWVVPSATAT